MRQKIILALLVGYLSQLQATTLQETLTLAKKNNYKTKSINQQVKAKKAEAQQAMTLENPYLGFEVENFGGDLSGLNNAEYTATLAFTLPSSGNRKRQANVINASGNIIRQRANLTEIELVQQVKQIFAEALAIQLKINNAQEYKELVLQTITETKQRMNAGIGSEQELLQAEHNLLKTELNIEQLAIEEKQALSLLNIYAGTKITTVDGNLFDWINTPIDKLFSETHPILLGLNAEKQTIDAEYELEKNSWKPDITMFAGIRNDGAEDATSFLVGFETPIPVLNRNTHGSRAINYRKQAIDFQQKQLEKEMLISWTKTIAKFNNATNKIHKIQTKLLPKITEVEKSTHKGYLAGTYRLTDLLLIQKDKAELETTMIDVVQEATDALCAIEFLQKEETK